MIDNRLRQIVQSEIEAIAPSQGDLTDVLRRGRRRRRTRYVAQTLGVTAVIGLIGVSGWIGTRGVRAPEVAAPEEVADLSLIVADGDGPGALADRLALLGGPPVVAGTATHLGSVATPTGRFDIVSHRSIGGDPRFPDTEVTCNAVVSMDADWSEAGCDGPLVDMSGYGYGANDIGYTVFIESPQGSSHATVTTGNGKTIDIRLASTTNLVFALWELSWGPPERIDFTDDPGNMIDSLLFHDVETAPASAATQPPTTRTPAPTTLFVEFRERLDERIASGRLDLGTIDRLWTEAEVLAKQPPNAAMAEEAMGELDRARVEQLVDLPPALSEYRDVLGAALIARDVDSRIAARRLLAGLDKSQSLSDDEHNLIQSILGALMDVQHEVLRLDILESGRIGPALDPDRLPELPDRVLLVHWADLSGWYNLAVLVGLDGVPIGYLDDQSIWEIDVEGGKVVYEPVPDPGPDNMEGCVVSWSDSDRDYLICEDSTTYDSVALRSEIRVRYLDGTEQRVAGPATLPTQSADRPVGSWGWAMPSPQGDALLAGWSGECSIGSAHIIANGSTVRAGRQEAPFNESYPLGWLDNDRALIVVTSSACSIQVDAAGIYTMTTDGGIEPVYLTTTGGATARLIETAAP